jgi:hypothetical protein
VYHIDPDLKVKNVAMWRGKEADIIFVACGQGRISCCCWIAMNAFFLECDPNLSLGMLHDSAAGLC